MRLPTWLGPGKLRPRKLGFPNRGSLTGTASFSLDASTTPQMIGSAGFSLDASGQAYSLGGLSRMNAPQWLGPMKLRRRKLGFLPPPATISGTIGFAFDANATPASPIAGVAGFSFGASANPAGGSPTSKLRPPQWLGPGKLRQRRLGITPPPAGPISGTASFTFDATATVTRQSVRFKYTIGPSNRAPFSPTQFTTRPPAYSTPGPITGSASIVFGASASASTALAGTAAFAIDASGQMRGSIQANGTATIVFGAIAIPEAFGQMAGTSAFSLDAIATPAMGAMSGTADMAFDASANATEEIKGTADMAFDAIGTVVNANPAAGLSGTAAFYFDALMQGAPQFGEACITLTAQQMIVTLAPNPPECGC